MITMLLGGLAAGAVYALVAFGYNLTWTVSRVVNFAHGALILAGMFLTVWCYSIGLNFVVTFVVLIVVGGVIALIEYVIAIWPVMKDGAHAELVTTVGVMTLIQGALLLLLTEHVTRVPSIFPEALISLPDGKVSVADLALISFAIVVGIGMHLWTRHTSRGQAAGALSEDRDAALLLGVNAPRFSTLAFMVSGSLAFVSASFVGPKTYLVIEIAAILAVKGFTVLAIGGLGSQLGALLGGLIVGLVEAFSGRFLGGEWPNIAVFLVFLLVLIVRPQGLLGQKAERAV